MKKSLRSCFFVLVGIFILAGCKKPATQTPVTIAAYSVNVPFVVNYGNPRVGFTVDTVYSSSFSKNINTTAHQDYLILIASVDTQRAGDSLFVKIGDRQFGQPLRGAVKSVSVQLFIK